MSDTPQPVQNLTPSEAAIWLNIEEPALKSLVRAGFIKMAGSKEFALAEVKAFSARNTQASFPDFRSPDETDNFDAIADVLETQIEELAQTAHATFAKAVPETRQWTEAQREDFIQQARGRFSAILAVISQGAQVDSSLRADLEEVGANAAWAGASLPHLQLVLRISRDLLVQHAMRIANQHEGRLDANLDAFLVRLLPAIDNLLDAIGHGFWNAQLDDHRNLQGRLSSLIEKLPYPIYEADIDGLLRHVNVAFTRMFQKSFDELIGQPLSNVVVPVEGDVSSLLAEPDGDAGRASLVVTSPIGGNVRLDVDTAVRRVDGDVEGFAGLMRIKPA